MHKKEDIIKNLKATISGLDNRLHNISDEDTKTEILLNQRHLMSSLKKLETEVSSLDYEENFKECIDQIYTTLNKGTIRKGALFEHTDPLQTDEIINGNEDNKGIIEIVLEEISRRKEEKRERSEIILNSVYDMISKKEGKEPTHIEQYGSHLTLVDKLTNNLNIMYDNPIDKEQADQICKFIQEKYPNIINRKSDCRKKSQLIKLKKDELLDLLVYVSSNHSTGMENFNDSDMDYILAYTISKLPNILEDVSLKEKRKDILDYPAKMRTAFIENDYEELTKISQTHEFTEKIPYNHYVHTYWNIAEKYGNDNEDFTKKVSELIKDEIILREETAKKRKKDIAKGKDSLAKKVMGSITNHYKTDHSDDGEGFTSVVLGKKSEADIGYMASKLCDIIEKSDPKVTHEKSSDSSKHFELWIYDTFAKKEVVQYSDVEISLVIDPDNKRLDVLKKMYTKNEDYLIIPEDETVHNSLKDPRAKDRTILASRERLKNGLLMPYVKARNLFDIIESRNKISGSELKLCLHDSSYALEHIHNLGRMIDQPDLSILHGDIKLANYLGIEVDGKICGVVLYDWDRAMIIEKNKSVLCEDMTMSIPNSTLKDVESIERTLEDGTVIVGFERNLNSDIEANAVNHWQMLTGITKVIDPVKKADEYMLQKVLTGYVKKGFISLEDLLSTEQIEDASRNLNPLLDPEKRIENIISQKRDYALREFFSYDSKAEESFNKLKSIKNENLKTDQTEYTENTTIIHILQELHKLSAGERDRKLSSKIVSLTEYFNKFNNTYSNIIKGIENNEYGPNQKQIDQTFNNYKEYFMGALFGIYSMTYAEKNPDAFAEICGYKYSPNKSSEIVEEYKRFKKQPLPSVITFNPFYTQKNSMVVTVSEGLIDTTINNPAKISASDYKTVLLEAINNIPDDIEWQYRVPLTDKTQISRKD